MPPHLSSSPVESRRKLLSVQMRVPSYSTPEASISRTASLIGNPFLPRPGSSSPTALFGTPQWVSQRNTWRPCSFLVDLPASEGYGAPQIGLQHNVRDVCYQTQRSLIDLRRSMGVWLGTRLRLPRDAEPGNTEPTMWSTSSCLFQLTS